MEARAVLSAEQRVLFVDGDRRRVTRAVEAAGAGHRVGADINRIDAEELGEEPWGLALDAHLDGVVRKQLAREGDCRSAAPVLPDVRGRKDVGLARVLRKSLRRGQRSGVSCSLRRALGTEP
jgi:hypothetical protein